MGGAGWGRDDGEWAGENDATNGECEGWGVGGVDSRGIMEEKLLFNIDDMAVDDVPN